MPNVAPLFLPTNLQITTEVGAPATFTAQATDSDSLFITFSAAAPTHGTVTGSGSGTFTYTPYFGFVGTDMVNVTVSDAQGGSSTQTYLIDVVSVPVSLLNSSIDGAGDTITLYFDRTLDSAHLPAADQFSISTTGPQPAPAVTSVEVVGNRVTLHLSAVLPDNESVSFSYTAVPGSLTDLSGGDISSIAVTPVTNDLSLAKSSAIEFGRSSGIQLDGAEISAFDPDSNRIFSTGADALQVIQVESDLTMTLLGTIPLGEGITSVAVSHGIVAVAVVGPDKTQPGRVYFIDADAPVGPGAILGSVRVGPNPDMKIGANPDMVAFTPDGKKVLVANEGELAEGGTDPVGSVSIIDISRGVAGATVTTAGFEAFNSQLESLKAAGVRLFAGEEGFENTTVAQDLEPEYITISADGATAFVTLQENNAIGILDIASGTFTNIVPLGLKSFKGLRADFSDRDNGINLTTGNPVFGQFMPDGIGSFTGVDGETYLVIANEGDDRDDFLVAAETSRVSGLTLDSGAFPNAASLQANGLLGRLTVSNAPGNNGDLDGDGDVDQLLTYGARSFSILDSQGNIVFDSGSHIEQFVALGGVHDSGSNTGLFDDSRSDNKGPEPEGLTIGVFGDSVLAFIALERGGGGVMVYDVTDPENVEFVQYVRNLNDISPEGLTYVKAADSPNGQPLLIVSNEVSGTVTVYEIVEPGTFTLQLLHFADGEAGLLASQTAPNLAALVDAFEDDYVNSITLVGGDNFIPGPFYAAGADPSIASVLPGGNTQGRVDIALHNFMGVQASAIGNHEFDFGSQGFRDAFAPAGAWVGAQFPYVSANLDFSGDSVLSSTFTETLGIGGLENAANFKGKIVPSAVIEENGELIGIVGLTTQLLEQISSPTGTEVKGFPTGPGSNGEVDNMALLAQQLQPYVDDLAAQGVNKIILLSHLQLLGNEKALAPLLKGVDIIVGAGSNTRLGDADDVAVAFPGHAANFADTYPIVTAGADGKATVIVNTDNEYTYLGRLVVEFDSDGEIIAESLSQFVSVNGAYASTDANVAEAWNTTIGNLEATAFANGTRGDAVRDVTDAVQNVIDVKSSNVFGYSDVYLEGARAAVRTQETNLGDVSADANADAARDALGLTPGDPVVSLKNGGGIRAQIGTVSGTGSNVTFEPNPGGVVSQLDVENSLRFDNALMVFETTPQGLLNILNNPAGLTPNNGGFIQIGGIQFSYDPSLPAGARVRDIALVDENGNKVAAIADDGVVVAGAPATITMVTLNFTANGGDGFPVKANGSNFRFLLDDGTVSAPIDEALNFTDASVVPANALGEQQAFADYFTENFGTPEIAFDIADTPPELDLRIQNQALREDTVLDGFAIPAPIAVVDEVLVVDSLAFA